MFSGRDVVDMAKHKHGQLCTYTYYLFKYLLRNNNLRRHIIIKYHNI